jgi:NADH dehydrogenase
MAALHGVTGPFSYTGRYIARRLGAEGTPTRGFLRDLTTKPAATAVDCRSLQFEDRDQLARDLEGVDVLYNTYWIRFERGASTFAGAVHNTGVLAEAAHAAGVKRIVHISVSNPSADSPFAYFRGKAAAEDAIRSVGIPCSVIRPTLVFGREDVLINNMAWLMRRMPLFPIFGDGRHRVQPVFVDDVAALAVAEADQSGDRTLDAAGPVVQSFADFLRFLRASIGSRAPLVRVPPGLALAMAWPVSVLLKDVMITPEEIGALMADLLVSHAEPTTATSLEAWLAADKPDLGGHYTSELQRHWSHR